MVSYQLVPRQPHELGFPIHYTGHSHYGLSVHTLYCVADLLVTAD